MEKLEWNQVYIERCDKESENLLAEEGHAFLKEKIVHLKQNKNEFVYIESEHFNKIGVESFSLEMDDVFLTYNVLLGLKAPKKAETAIRHFLEEELQGDENKFALMFDGNDGLWNLNFTLDYVPDFRADMNFEEALNFIYAFLLRLVNEIK